MAASLPALASQLEGTPLHLPDDRHAVSARMRFVALTPELLQMMPVAERLQGQASLLATPDAIGLATTRGRALALIEGGRVMGAGGVFQMWEGRGLCWLLPGLWMERRHYARALYRCAAELHRLSASGYRRLECTILADDRSAARWATRLGFVAEGILHRFGPDGLDHIGMRWENRNG